MGIKNERFFTFRRYGNKVFKTRKQKRHIGNNIEKILRDSFMYTNNQKGRMSNNVLYEDGYLVCFFNPCDYTFLNSNIEDFELRYDEFVSLFLLYIDEFIDEQNYWDWFSNFQKDLNDAIKKVEAKYSNNNPLTFENMFLNTMMKMDFSLAR